MTSGQLLDQIQLRNNFLCVGLDPDLSKFPAHIERSVDGVIEFNRAIIEATKDYCVSYKVNFAFFEALGFDGWKALADTRAMLPDSHYLIADAKRGDIGNTAAKYAEAIFGKLDFDAVTLSPYMGVDVVKPFLKYPGKTSILLALTSNPGGSDFQLSRLADGRYAFEEVIEKSTGWGNADQIMYVVGATRPEFFATVRKWAPDHFLLVPGVGAQGGNLKEVYRHGRNDHTGLLVNSSRGIIFAGDGTDFAVRAAEAAKKLSEEMRGLMIGD